MLKHGLALAAAVLLILTFPRFGIAFLAPFALAPLLVALALENRPRTRALLGYETGVVFWAGTCYWIQFVLDFHAGMSTALSWVGLALFSIIKAVHFGLFGWLAGALMRRRWAVVTVPALWVAVERSNALTGFSWLALGNAGISMSIPMRLPPYTGVWGLSFVFAAMAAAVALVFLRRPRRELIPAAVLAVMFVLPGLPPARRGTETAGLVQPNISQDAEWTPEWVEAQQQRLLSLSLRAAPAELIVWPEVPAPLYYETDPRLHSEINALARLTGAYIILNTVPRLPSGEPLNSALLVGPEGRALGRYDKMNLVPFGEFVPWPFKALIAKVSTESGDFAPGEKQVLLPAGRHRIAAFVCYESVFPGFVRRFAKEGAELYVNISNDGWYGASAARDQHLLIARMRAAESRRWLLRATNDGITSTVDPAGRVQKHLPSFQAGAARTSFSWIGDVTFYSRWGDWFVWVCAAAAVLGLAKAPLPHGRGPVKPVVH